MLTRSVDPGQTVASSLQAPVLFVIAADLENMELKAAIDEADIGGVKSGQKARFTVDAFPERSFDAVIRDISFASVTTEGVVTYDARLDVDNQRTAAAARHDGDRLGRDARGQGRDHRAGGGFPLSPPTAETRLEPARPVHAAHAHGPSRRAAAGRRRSGTRTLYVLKDGAPQAVKVKTGSTDGEKTEIVSGLAEGDQVITATSATGQARG